MIETEVVFSPLEAFLDASSASRRRQQSGDDLIKRRADVVLAAARPPDRLASSRRSGAQCFAREGSTVVWRWSRGRLRARQTIA